MRHARCGRESGARPTLTNTVLDRVPAPPSQDDPADGMYIIISGRLRNLVGDERSKARAKARAKQTKKKKHGRRRRGSLNSQQGRVTSGQVATPSWRAKPASPDEDSEESDQDDECVRRCARWLPHAVPPR